MGSQDKLTTLIRAISIKMTKLLMIFAIFLATTVIIQAFPQATITESAQQKPFDDFDTDGDALLKKKEFNKGLRTFLNNIKEGKKFTRKKTNEAFAAADVNDDDRLDFEEFKTIESIKKVIEKFTDPAGDTSTAATTE